MKTNVKSLPYSWSSFGYASELITIEFVLSELDYNLQKLREIVKTKNRIIDEMSHEPSIGGQIDCTGKSFGSNWRKLDFTETEDGYIAVFIHSWAIDI